MQNRAFCRTGIFSLAGGEEFCVLKTGIPGGPGSNVSKIWKPRWKRQWLPLSWLGSLAASIWPLTDTKLLPYLRWLVHWREPTDRQLSLTLPAFVEFCCCTIYGWHYSSARAAECLKYTLIQGWKISWYFRKYQKYPLLLLYQAFAHTLLKLYEIYYQIIVCVCMHCILGEVLLSFTLHCCGEVKSDRSCPILRKCWGHKS